MSRVFTQAFGAVGAILEKDGKSLLVREAEWYDSGKWNHPAGWIEVGESPIDAVRREVKEETGFSLTPTHVLGIYSIVRKDLEKKTGATPHTIKIIFTGKISKAGGRLHGDVSEARWFSPSEIYSMDMSTLRDTDIKQMIRDYIDCRKYDTEMIIHTISG